MFFVNFLKSLVVPRYMSKYRAMSVFIAFGIFFVSSLILAIPQMTNISKNRYKLVDDQNAYYLNIFKELNDENINVLNETSFKLEYGHLTYGEDIEKGSIQYYDFVLEKDFIRIGFDTYDILDPEAKPNVLIFDSFNEIEKPVNGNKYLIVFYNESAIYYSPTFQKELKYQENNVFDFSKIEGGSEISYHLMDLYIPDINIQVSFNTFIACVIFPLLISLVLWLFLRSGGNTLSFKETYNIASISSIVPFIIIFALSWIFPHYEFVSYYSVLFGIYFLIMMLIINSKKKIA